MIIAHKIAALGIGAAVVGFLSLPAWSEEYPKLALRYATFFSPTTPQSSVVKWWAEEIEKRSGGNITIKIYWSETLSKADEILGLVGSGGVELGNTAPSYYPAQLPLSAMANNLPMVFDSNKTAVDVAMAASKEPMVIQENEKQRVKILFYHSLANYHVACTKPVKTVADFSGLKIRSYGEFIPKLWDSLGAIGVNVIAPEIYEGLQRGNLDCAYWPPDYFVSYKLYEAAKYISTVDFGAVAGQANYVNLDLWERWPENVRSLFEQVSAEAVEMDKEIVAKAYADAMAELGKRIEVVEFTEQDLLEETVPDFLQLWLESMKSRGLEAEAQELEARARAAIAK